MNTNDATRATAEGLPASEILDPIAPKGPHSCTLDMAALRQMDMEQLHSLRKVFHTLDEITSAFSNTARFGDTSDYNAAGKVLCALSEFLSNYEQAVVNVAKAAKPTSRNDVEWRSWTVVGFEADMADDLTDFVVVAANAARDERAAS